MGLKNGIDVGLMGEEKVTVEEDDKDKDDGDDEDKEETSIGSRIVRIHAMCEKG